jgi:hypothetical protein
VKEVEDALIESAKEADRQKRFVERDCANLKHRLESAGKEITHISKTKLAENRYELRDSMSCAAKLKSNRYSAQQPHL